MNGTMLILRGKAGLLDQRSAEEYARRQEYTPFTLPEAGMPNGLNTKQFNRALLEFRRDEDVHALYGFSGGGYNVRWIISVLKPAEKDRLKLVVVLGAPQKESLLKGPWDLVYRENPKGSYKDDWERHMDGPAALLRETP